MNGSLLQSALARCRDRPPVTILRAATYANKQRCRAHTLKPRYNKPGFTFGRAHAHRLAPTTMQAPHRDIGAAQPSSTARLGIHDASITLTDRASSWTPWRLVYHYLPQG